MSLEGWGTETLEILPTVPPPTQAAECVKVLSRVLGLLIEHITNVEESVVLQDEGIWA